MSSLRNNRNDNETHRLRHFSRTTLGDSGIWIGPGTHYKKLVSRPFSTLVNTVLLPALPPFMQKSFDFMVLTKVKFISHRRHCTNLHRANLFFLVIFIIFKKLMEHLPLYTKCSHIYKSFGACIAHEQRAVLNKYCP